MSNEHDRQWAERLEAEAKDDELLALAARLRRAGQTTRATPSLAFQRQLRRDLMDQHAAAPRHGATVWRWAGSLAAVGLLAVVVGLMWFSISSSGRPAFGGAPLETAAYVEWYGYSTLEGLAPGETVPIITHWRIPDGVAATTAYAHLLDSAGKIMSQADMALTADEEAWLATLVISLPDTLPPGDYTIVAGLLDAKGARLPVVDRVVTDAAIADKSIGWKVELGALTVVPVATAEPRLTILDISPAAGASLTGTQPITFTVRLAYEAVSAPAILEVKINEVIGASGRGVATAQVTLEDAAGEITVPVVLHPAQELNAPAEFGLWLQLRADAGSPPERIEMPEAYRWRYTP